MNFLPPHCSELSNNVNAILDLVPESQTDNRTFIVESSLAKAIAPKFEIVALVNA